MASTGTLALPVSTSGNSGGNNNGNGGRTRGPGIGSFDDLDSWIPDNRLYTAKEIAELLNCKRDFVYKRFHRLRRAFRAHVPYLNEPKPGRYKRQMRVTGWLLKRELRRMMGGW